MLAQGSRQPEIDPWQLYLVDWGYNTAEERAAATANPRIQVVDLAALQKATNMPAKVIAG